MTRGSRRPAAASLAPLAVLVLCLAGPAAGVVVTRGPYLQRATPFGVTVRWRTDVATDSVVRYGPSPGSLGSQGSNPAVSTEHEVVLSSLTPATPYFYSVGSSSQTLAGDDANHHFRTSPTPGTRTPLRVWVIGDSGTANASAAAVRDAYLAFPGAGDTDLWLMLGDNAYPSGTDLEYQAAVFAMYPSLLRTTPLWSTFGNHDDVSASSSTQTGPYYDIFTLPRLGEAGGAASGTEAYYSFDFANVHFVCLDSSGSPRTPGSAMLTWLQNDLLATTQDWVIAFWHHPPYSKGSHNSDAEIQLIEMRQYALPILEAGGVDLVLTGHSHSYERSILLDGHYGLSTSLLPSMILDGGDGDPASDGAYEKPQLGASPHDGAVHAVAGSSGQISGGLLNHPVMVRSLNVLGSLVIDVDGSELDARFLDAAGVVRDTFALHKPAPGTVACADGIDNDRDGPRDFPADPGCRDAAATLEDPRCNDGVDNDGDTLVDLADPACTAAWRNAEAQGSGCGLGFEAAVAVAALDALRRRRAAGGMRA
jgi:hypothetical protein